MCDGVSGRAQTFKADALTEGVIVISSSSILRNIQLIIEISVIYRKLLWIDANYGA